MALGGTTTRKDKLMDHLLLKRATTFEPGKRLSIEGWIYRKDIGAWVDADSPNVLMMTDELVPPYRSQTPFFPSDSASPKYNPDPQPPRPKPRPMSKKADMETGEDMKGE